MYDSCLFGSTYCYATTSFTVADKAHSAHDPQSESLVGGYTTLPIEKKTGARRLVLKQSQVMDAFSPEVITVLETLITPGKPSSSNTTSHYTQSIGKLPNTLYSTTCILPLRPLCGLSFLQRWQS